MCDPVSAGMFAVSAVSQVAQHQQARKAVDQRNRQRLTAFDNANDNYLVETMLNNNVWKNDVIVNEYEQEQVITAMTSQWEQYDAQLDQLFANADFKLQDSLIKMYKNDYAGEGTGVTAGRRAAQSAREHGFRVAEETAKLVLNMEEVELRRESIGIEGNQKINALFEKVRFPPVPGQTPIPPELEAKPSNASLFLGLASSALMSVGFSKLTAAKNTGMTNISDAAGHAADHGRTLAESTAILNPNQYVETVIDSSGIGQSVVKTWPTLPPRITTSASSGSYWAGL